MLYKYNWAEPKWENYMRSPFVLPHCSPLNLPFIYLSSPSDFRRRFLALLSYQFSSFHPSLALNILQNKTCKETASRTFTTTNMVNLRRVAKPDLTNFCFQQLSVAPSWQPLSALMISNVWSCIQGAWWTTTSSWTSSQLWLACSFSSSSAKSPSRQHSV